MLKRTLIILGSIVFLVGCIVGFKLYKGFLQANVSDQHSYLYIPTGADFEHVIQILGDSSIVQDTASFRWAAEIKDYPGYVKPGKYKMTPGMNNRQLINMLISGMQEPVRFQFQNLRLRGQLAKAVENHLEPDSLSVMAYLSSDSIADAYGFNRENFFCMFIPNTYEFFWNISIQDFFDRMHSEYQKFWNEERLAKADSIGLSPIEVSILASIVKGEALHQDEMPKIAGLYMNRLKRNILLQADPTVIYATQDFSIRRVLNKHLRTPSPYNTYIHPGLPPGPIMMPSIAAIDAVLNYMKHDYIYMCAKADFSGYHNYAKTVREHLVNARAFQRALNERNIKQ